MFQNCQCAKLTRIRSGEFYQILRFGIFSISVRNIHQYSVHHGILLFFAVLQSRVLKRVLFKLPTYLFFKIWYKCSCRIPVSLICGYSGMLEKNIPEAGIRSA
jgi:hypothetical protein